MESKIVVANFSGNVGKSTISRLMVLPRLQNAQFFKIETINADEDGKDSDASNLRGDQFGALSKSLPLIDSAVVDVGASNAESFILKMQDYAGAHDDFDYFLIPTVPASKQIRDTIATVVALAGMGVPQHKIKMVFNKIGKGQTVETEFAPIVAFAKEEQLFDFNPQAIIYETELFAELNGETIEQILESNVDEMKAAIKAAESQDEKFEISRRIAAFRLAQSVKANFDSTFKILFG